MSSQTDAIKRIAMGHSLGNMVVCEALREGLSWKGRFSGLHDLINCYSSTEEVLANPTSRKFFGHEWEGFGGAWSQQELFKGCSVWYPINALTFSGVRIEGGWGINAAYMADPLAYIPLYGFLPYYFANFSTGDIITQPLFTSFNDSRMHSTAALNIEDYQLRAKMLGDAIPAETFAVGANPFDDESIAVDYNYQSQVPNGWPHEEDEVLVWGHSDIKNVAYIYTYEFFRKITTEEANDD